MRPYAAPEALMLRFDSVCGKGGWSFDLAPLGSDALVANLSLLGTTRAAVVKVGPAPAPQAADLALANCAAMFGLGLPFAAEDESYWVEFDPEAGEPLYLPEPVALEAEAPEPAMRPVTRAPSTQGAPALAAPVAPMNDVAVATPAVAATNAGHEVIERLLERLKDEGMGKEAARLVVRYNGYGRTAEESRELYGRLRSLLMNSGAEST